MASMPLLLALRAACWPLPPAECGLVLHCPPRSDIELRMERLHHFSACFGRRQAAPLSSDSAAVRTAHIRMSVQSSVTQELYLCLLRDSGRPILLGKYNRTKSMRHFKRHTPNSGCLLSRHLPHQSGALFFTRTKASLSQPEIGRIVVMKHQIGCCTSWKRWTLSLLSSESKR